MKKGTILFFLLAFTLGTFAQDGFRFEPASKSKVVIPFKLINNLIFIPIKVNGVELTFLLDSGVDQTLLFSLDDKGDVNFFDIQKIKLKGLGSADAIEGLKSSGNNLSFPGLSDKKHDIYIILDQDFNFSSNIGIPVNGIIGYNFFKDYLVEINYDHRKITIYNENPKIRKRINSRFKAVDISVENNKPYTAAGISMKKDNIPVKLLIDLGNSDAIWLFPDKSDSIKVPQKNFDDFLGRGFSGDIHGKRGRIPQFDFHNYKFENPIAAFPDSSSIRNITMVENRVGSIGGEILKRFTIVLDYKNNKMFLRTGRDYNAAFNYNMSGIEIHHSGLKWVPEKEEIHSVDQGVTFDANGEKIPNTFKYKFELKPIYAIMNVRKDSPADLCGLQKGDIIISINRTPCERYTLQEINNMFKSEEGRLIELEVERNGKAMKFKFRLKSIL
ncbi:MAG TPA: PDZ domain-containing protein [Flavobacterium sp.]|nr:PDZ domain-containing protein [Flavobacterium sp.]